MVSTGVLKIGIAIRSPGELRHQAGTLLKRKDNNKLAIAA